MGGSVWKSAVLFALLCGISAVSTALSSSFSYPEERVEDKNTPWPTTMAFHETKTNYMLGEALLKRIYRRADFTENLIRLEMAQVYEKLKNEIQKNFRKCDRIKRRRVENGTSFDKSDKSHHNKRDKNDKKNQNRKNKGKKPNHEYGYEAQLQQMQLGY